MDKGRRFLPLETFHSEIRARFPLIDRDGRGNPRIYLNTGAGSLTVDSAAAVTAEVARGMNPMPGNVCPGELDTAGLHDRVRGIGADFLNAPRPAEISFHFSATAALFNLAYSLRSLLSPANNLVVTDLDHMANISPWETVWGEGAGCGIRRAKVTDGGTLDAEHLLSLVDGRTGVLALPLASNGFGSIVPLREIIAAVRGINPRVIVCVDAVHHALHGSIDVQDIDCDALVFSGYKVFGPMLGVLWGKAELLEKLRPYRVETNRDEPPYKFEMGMLNNSSLAALEAALSYLLWLADLVSEDKDSFPDRVSKFRAAFEAVTDYEKRLSRRVLEGLRNLPQGSLFLYGISDPDRASERDPTFAFEIPGESASATKKRLWESRSIQIADGNHYSAAVVRHLGKPALCRASFAHYDTFDTADRFLEAIRRGVDHV